jgi:twinkle protein
MCDFAKRNRLHTFTLSPTPARARTNPAAPERWMLPEASKITDGADNVFTVWSARKEQGAERDGKPDAMLELQKQRNGNTNHRKLMFFFNEQAQQFCLTADGRPVPIVEFSEDQMRETAHVRV